MLIKEMEVQFTMRFYLTPVTIIIGIVWLAGVS